MKGRALVIAASVAAAVLVGPSVAGATTDPVEDDRIGTPSPSVTGFAIAAAPTPAELAAALDVPAESVLGADLMGSDPVGTAILGPSSQLKFPTQGESFVVLSNGRATDALTPNNSSGLSTQLGGISNTQGQDLVRLHLKLHSPAEAHCLAFDLAFLSEEYPEYVGSQFNDAFTAQLNNPMLGVSGTSVEAPQNFAKDTQGNVLSVNTVFGMMPGAGTTYDGTTSTLRASTPVESDTDLDVYLSIQDLGDSIYDSAVFLDNFFWSADENCSYGSSEDTDGDGLLDDWETGGLDVRMDGVNHHVDLPAMGADKNVPDIFVETDYMTGSDHSHKPDPAAIKDVVDSFAAQGVHLHVDYGADAPNTYGATSTWGDLSDAESLPHTDHLGDNGLFGWFDYSWDAFDDIKSAHFDAARAAAFHYNVWAHEQSEQAGSSSGLSRGVSDGASDFIVSLGGFSGGTGTVGEQAGTFMHELGHNLGLHHGGRDDLNYKPNYLSLMNYSFQLTGLPEANAGRPLDYSIDQLFALNESDLDEADGAHLWNENDTTRDYSCNGNTRVLAYGPVDWNCDGDATDLNTSADTNKDGDRNVLEGSLDWGFLTYNGGSIGLPGDIREPQHMTFDSHEMTLEDLHAIQQSVVKLTGPIQLPATPVAVGTAVSATVPLTASVAPAVEWSWGDGATSAGTLTGTAPTWTASGSHTYTTPGIYTVTVTASAATASATAPVVVYDPTAGFATGGGTVTVPTGAVPGDPSQTGKARFGVTASYHAGSTEPSGELQLSWPQAGVSVHARDYDWLIVNDTTATAAGPAAFSGSDGYRFQLWLEDSPDGDRMRLLVWDPRVGDSTNAGAVLLDTTAGASPGSVVSGQVTLH